MPDVTEVPGLRYVPDWVGDDTQRHLLAAVDAATWSTELRRRVQHYGHRYDYGRRGIASGGDTSDAPPLPPWATALAARLYREGHLDRPADQVIVNEYQPGQGISAHIDCVPCFGPHIAAISLGSAVTMDFISPDRTTQVPIRLAPGSLCVMTGPSRYTWRHAIAARKSDPTPHGRVPRTRRVSLTFRTVTASTP